MRTMRIVLNPAANRMFDYLYFDFVTAALIVATLACSQRSVVSTAFMCIRKEDQPVLGAKLVELRPITERSSLLTALHNAPRSDRLTMRIAAAASISMLIAAGVVLPEP